MDSLRIFIVLISLFVADIYSQDVTVSLKPEKEMPRAGDPLLLTCTISGTINSTDNVLFRKIESDGSSVILDGTTNSNQNNWLVTAFTPNDNGSPGGTQSLFSSELKSSDIGKYSCTVLRDTTTLGQDEIHLDILYVPTIKPYCATDPFPQSNSNYYDGELVTFSCTLDPGNPTVNLTWSRSDNVSLPPLVITVTEQYVLAEIKTILTISDSGVLFTCKSTSDGFPLYIDLCLPIRITVVPRPTTTPRVTTPQPTTTQQPTEPTTSLKTVTSKSLKTFTEPTTSQYLSSVAASKTLSESTPTSSSLLGIDLRIWIIAGGSGGLLIIVILIISLCCIIRYCKCCSRDPKLILPTRNGPSSYYNDIKLEPDLEMRQTNNGKEGIVPHVSSADGTLYARVNKDRKSVNSRHFRKQDDPPPYPDSEFDDSSQGGYYHDYNGSDEQDPEPPKRTASERLYEIPPSDSDNEEPVQEDQYGNVTNVKPSYLDDLDPHYGNLE